MNKALLEVGGRSNIDRVVDALRPLCQELVLVANDEALAERTELRVILDDEAHAGVLPALANGLAAARGELAIVVACDMPFLNGHLLSELVSLVGPVEVAIPAIDDRPEPMHAVYRREPCLAAIRAALAAGERRMISFLDRLRVERVAPEVLRRFDPELLSFFNTNSPDDLEQARRIAARG